MPESMRVERVPADATFPLRQRVLRPNKTVAELALPGDEDPDSGHFAAVGADGQVVGTASVRREAPPWASEVPDGWRLRGMAVEEDLRGRGLGERLLTVVLEHVRGLGGGFLWCNARIPAQAFYQRAGLRIHGEPWEDPDIGPHSAMWMAVPAEARS